MAANAAPETQLRSPSLSLCIHLYILQGNMRLAGELWRYVRIIHGSFETFVHSPLVFFLFIAKKKFLRYSVGRGRLTLSFVMPT